MSLDKPLVSIGLPVYNGENFLQQAIDSILAQTFEDFELVISDNASIDKTEEICQKYVGLDQRVHYYRSPQNLGAAPNYNRVFSLSKGKYFKWLAHDDMCAPEFLEQCVDILEQDSSFILCHSKIRIINAQGMAMDENDELLDWVASGTQKINTDSQKPYERFYSVIGPYPCYQVFGLIRASALKKTRLIESYSSSDRILLAKLALMGKFYEHSTELLYLRRHLNQSIQELASHRSAQKYTHWFDSATKGRIIFPRWQALGGLITSINESPLSWREKAACYRGMLPWIRRARRALGKDLVVAMLQAKNNFLYQLNQK